MVSITDCTSPTSFAYSLIKFSHKSFHVGSKLYSISCSRSECIHSANCCNENQSLIFRCCTVPYVISSCTGKFLSFSLIVTFSFSLSFSAKHWKKVTNSQVENSNSSWRSAHASVYSRFLVPMDLVGSSTKGEAA